MTPLQLDFLGGDTLIFFLIVVFVAFIVVSFVRNLRGGEEIDLDAVETQTELVCPECGLKEVRSHREGDYVGLETEEECKSCGHTLVVDGIYSLEKEEA